MEFSMDYCIKVGELLGCIEAFSGVEKIRIWEFGADEPTEYELGSIPAEILNTKFVTWQPIFFDHSIEINL